MNRAPDLHTAAPSLETSVDIVVDSDVFELVPRAAAHLGLAPGDLISENLRLVSLLGTGGMGNVWLAEHTGLETRVAVKFMSSELAEDPACVARFAAEAKLAARIKNPHVVNILDFAQTGSGVPYIVMELLEGQDLETCIGDGRALCLEDASRVFVQICKALASAHELGIVHRDIKPDNILLVSDEGEIFVKVLDFGIAKDERQAHSITVSGTTMGTPGYMSPEQLFRPKEVDLRSDLWSAAVVAYRCLTGKLPFEGDSFGSICLSVHDGAFAAPSSLNPRLPPGLDAWFARALSLDPAARFSSATAMANAYLAELDKAKLLPHWAALRATPGKGNSYSSDPGGISGGPIVLQKRKSPGLRALVLGALFATAAAVAATPREDFVTFANGWFLPFGELPLLHPTAEEPPLLFHQPPRFWAPPSTSAIAPRDVVRMPMVPRPGVPWTPYDGATPAGTIERRFPETPSTPSAVFGI